MLNYVNRAMIEVHCNIVGCRLIDLSVLVPTFLLRLLSVPLAKLVPSWTMLTTSTVL